MNPYQTPKSEMVETLTPDLSDLIAKLSEATAGSDELSALVFCALNDGYQPGVGIQLGAVIRPGRGATGGSMRTPEPVTTSVDAALALIEKRLPGWSYFIDSGNGRPLALLQEVWNDTPTVEGYGATPGLALCIALLRSLQAQQTAALKPEGGET